VSTAKDDQWLRGSLVAIVLLHLVVALWHGSSHEHVPVPLTTAQTAYVGLVIVLLPLVGAGLLWTKRKRGAAWLIGLSMLASLLFGLINHFVLDSPDHVMEVPAHVWRHSFILSAALLVVTETMGTVMGAVAARVWRQAA
jgi:hypothetical protein